MFQIATEWEPLRSDRVPVMVPNIGYQISESGNANDFTRGGKFNRAGSGGRNQNFQGRGRGRGPVQPERKKKEILCWGCGQFMCNMSVTRLYPR